MTKKFGGETVRIFKLIVDGQRGYVNNKKEGEATGAHFNIPGQSLANIKAIVKEQVNIKDE